MSHSVIQTLGSAKKFNATASVSLGWANSIPPNALEKYPLLSNPADSNDFALGVIQFQTAIYGKGSSQIDGKLGRGTWAELLKLYDYVESLDAYWVHKDRRVRVDSSTQIINFDQDGGLDLHRFGHFSTRRNKPPHLIVVHWGGLDPRHCFRVFSDPDRKVSSHAGIGLNEQEATIYQWLDLQHISWHGGWVNPHSVGIDICQQPDVKWKDHYTKLGYQVSIVDNPTSRGPSKVLSLDPRIAQATRSAVKSLCDTLDVPYRFPNTHDVLDKDFLVEDFKGVVGHHHLTDNKWDIACWWDSIFG